MPWYYCDYCDTYLTHDSPSVRKQPNAGYKHKANRIKEHLGQAAVFQQVGAAYNQHLMAQRPRLPVLPTPVMPIPGSGRLNSPLVPGMRPPVLLRPIPGPPGYMHAPGMPPMMAPPGAPHVPVQLNGLPRPPAMMNPTTVTGNNAPPVSSSGAPSMPTPTAYRGFDSFNANAQAPEANH